MAGGKVFPVPEVIEMPVTSLTSAATPISGVFPVCTITRVQSRKFDDVIDFADTIMATLDGKKFPTTKSGRIKSGNDVTILMARAKLKVKQGSINNCSAK